jgi:hypothetical protein
MDNKYNEHIDSTSICANIATIRDAREKYKTHIKNEIEIENKDLYVDMENYLIEYIASLPQNKEVINAILNEVSQTDKFVIIHKDVLFNYTRKKHDYIKGIFHKCIKNCDKYQVDGNYKIGNMFKNIKWVHAYKYLKDNPIKLIINNEHSIFDGAAFVMDVYYEHHSKQENLSWITSETCMSGIRISLIVNESYKTVKDIPSVDKSSKCCIM